ncbi:hypothetical protein B0O99DRAFT_735718 [Bisporella sp. PMI_857]|nr:hypothetical protein B0O99DRAFT_735718 [Bisporella sp. PMI_857]
MMASKEPLPKSRSIPMEILVLGLCRTGTMSMKLALEDLGYKNVYHFSEVTDRPTHPALWISAMGDKFGTSPKPSFYFDATYFDNILGDYDAVTDIPTACFAADLIKAYPSAKIILTTRSTRSWLASMTSTIHALQSSKWNRFLLQFSSAHVQSQSQLVDLIIEHYFNGSIPLHGAEAFEKHNETVRKVANHEGRDILEYKLGDGWEPLCKFLGKDLPDTMFPHVNKRERWRVSFGLTWMSALRNVLELVFPPVIAAPTVIVVVLVSILLWKVLGKEAG